MDCLLRDPAVDRPINRPLPCTNEFRGPGFRVCENSEEIISKRTTGEAYRRGCVSAYWGGRRRAYRSGSYRRVAVLTEQSGHGVGDGVVVGKADHRFDAIACCTQGESAQDDEQGRLEFRA